MMLRGKLVPWNSSFMQEYLLTVLGQEINRLRPSVRPSVCLTVPLFSVMNRVTFDLDLLHVYGS